MRTGVKIVDFTHSIEQIGGGMELVVTPEHTFGTDSFLLSRFAAPKKRETACDLCTGCGIVPLLWFRGEDAPRLAYGVDLRRRAVEQLRLSVERSGLGGRVEPVEADLRDLRGRVPLGGLDLVTCNPPYRARGTGLLSREESARVARHEVECTLEDVCRAAAGLLRFGGRFCMCQMPERLVDVLSAMREHKLEPKRLRFVQQTASSAPWLVLVEGKRGAKPFLQLESPLVLRENGEISAEMAQIYGMYGRV